MNIIKKRDLANVYIKNVIKQARDMGLTSLFALTTQTAHWFEDKDWVEITVDDLPAEKATEYSTHRNSKIFKLDLNNL